MKAKQFDERHLLIEAEGVALNVAILDLACEIEALLALFEEVAHEQGWQPGLQLMTLNRNAIYFALQCGETLVGGLQLIRSRADRLLPCLDVWPELKLPEYAESAEIVLLALQKEYRGSAYFWPLTIEMWRYCRAAGIVELWVEATPANLRIYRRLGWPLHVAGPLRAHWGEDCYPCYLRVQEVKDVIVEKAQKSLKYRLILAQACRNNFSAQEGIPCRSGTA